MHNGPIRGYYYETDKCWVAKKAWHTRLLMHVINIKHADNNAIYSISLITHAMR